MTESEQKQPISPGVPAPNVTGRRDGSDANGEGVRAPLTFDDALRIARGCTDYGGGYRSDREKFAAFQHGIRTVINALTAAGERGLADTQIVALYRMGAAEKEPTP